MRQRRAPARSTENGERSRKNCFSPFLRYAVSPCERRRSKLFVVSVPSDSFSSRLPERLLELARLLGFRQLRLEARELRIRHPVGVFGRRESPPSDIRDIRLEGRADRALQIRVRLDEARHVTRRDAEEIVPHEDLAVARRTGADPDGRDPQRVGDVRGDGGRDGLEHDGKTARALERARFVEDAARLRGGPAARLVAFAAGPPTAVSGRRAP